MTHTPTTPPPTTTTTKPAPPARRPRRVVFFHAHPDDEAIFTGGTIALLAAAGCSITLVVATSGQLGTHPPGHHGDLGPLRESETAAASELLGVQDVEFLRYRDTGMPGDPANHHPDAFHTADTHHAATRLAAIATQHHTDAIVIYDAGGIYGHPDHIQIHRVGTLAAQLAAIPTIYETTIDRDYLHTTNQAHLVNNAHKPFAHLALGVPTTTITTTIHVASHHLHTKHAAITAHRSQIPPTASPATMPPDTFAHLYGHEWYIRHGPPNILEHLARPLSTAA